MNDNKQTSEGMQKVHILLRVDQYEELKKLGEFAGTSLADVIRQLIDNQKDEIHAAIDLWSKRGGLFQQRGNVEKKKKPDKLGFKAI